ncbi:MAG: cell division ATP-binding protein FtsE [Desulfobulbus sp.]
MTTDNPPPDVLIDLIKVSKTYPPDVQALTNISLSVHRGEIVYLTGMSGAGKTTLLRLISRMEKPSKGMVDVAGFDLAKLPQRKIHLLRRKIGMAYQDFKLLPDRSVADNIAIAMEVLYTPRPTIERRTRELLEQLDLSRKYATRAGELSRGEQQRVAIARAVANVPEIVLADEPTGNLDGETTARVMDLFYRLNRKGSTLLIATHDPSLYRPGRDRVIELRFGCLRTQLQSDTASPQHYPEATDSQQEL